MTRGADDLPERDPAPNPYAGRWLAFTGKHIAGQGGTPQQALDAARSNRYKEQPRSVYMPLPKPLTFPSLLEKILPALPDDEKIYLVGGAVRDAVLGIEGHDLDFVVYGDGIKTGRRVANTLYTDFYPLDDERKTSRLIITAPDRSRNSVDFASLRGNDLEADLRARDFTINAMAVDVHALQELLDPLSGLVDLRHKQLRACTHSSLTDDPIRILRGVRLAADYDLHIVAETRQAMKASASKLAGVSAERQRDEFFRILESQRPVDAIKALDTLGALAVILPELKTLKHVEQPSPHISDAWEHTLATLQALQAIIAIFRSGHAEAPPDSPLLETLAAQLGRFEEQIGDHLATRLVPDRSHPALLAFTALFHDSGKPGSRSIEDDSSIHFYGHEKTGAAITADRARQLQLSNDEINLMERIIRNHMRVHSLVIQPGDISSKSIYRFYRGAGSSGIDVCLLGLADAMATYGPSMPPDIWARYLEVTQCLMQSWWERRHQVVEPLTLLDGDTLQREYNLPPSPLIGKIKAVLQEAQASGAVSSLEEAHRFVYDFIQSQNNVES